MRRSRPPVLAIQAAAGEIPSANPRKRCDQFGEALREGIENSTAMASGASFSASVFNCHAAMKNTATAVTVKSHANCSVSYLSQARAVLYADFRDRSGDQQYGSWSSPPNAPPPSPRRSTGFGAVMAKP